MKAHGAGLCGCIPTPTRPECTMRWMVSDLPMLSETRMSAVSYALATLGWDVQAIDIDLVAGRAKIELRRADGLLVTLAADGHGRASVTRELTVLRRGTCGAGGARGRGFIVERVATEFLGRTRYEGLRAALRGLAHYVALNSAVPVRLADSRRIFAAIVDDTAARSLIVEASE